MGKNLFNIRQAGKGRRHLVRLKQVIHQRFELKKESHIEPLCVSIFDERQYQCNLVLLPYSKKIDLSEIKYKGNFSLIEGGM